MPRARPPAVSIELRDLAAAADLIEALRGIPPATEAAARRRTALADRLAHGLFHRLTSTTKGT